MRYLYEYHQPEYGPYVHPHTVGTYCVDTYKTDLMYLIDKAIFKHGYDIALIVLRDVLLHVYPGSGMIFISNFVYDLTEALRRVGLRR